MRRTLLALLILTGCAAGETTGPDLAVTPPPYKGPRCVLYRLPDGSLVDICQPPPPDTL